MSGGGQEGGTPGGKSYEDARAEVLKELVARLQDHSESLRRDIRRLQRALVGINGAIALSLDRVERLRANTQRLQAIFGDADDSGSQGEDPKLRKEQRSGAERRSGIERRRPRSEVTGLLRWIEGTTLDRRKAPDRRSVDDRRRTREQSIENSNRLVVPMTFRKQPGGDVISLADYRRSRKAASCKLQP